ncbi:MAG: thermonuclease family protein [Nanoarchaeota archaeon]|nr:thermonuclease family protein [Nanoarchaeota archaeon]
MNTYVRGLCFIIIVILIVVVPGLFYSDEIEGDIVVRVLDGDTVEVSGEDHIRLLGINAPERGMKLYQEAKDYLLFLEGKEVEMEFFEEEYDKYGRKLRYVFYNNRNINRELVLNGLANVLIYQEDDYSDELIEAEDYARDNELGIWKKSFSKCSDCVKIVFANKDIEFRNNCGFGCDLSGWRVKDRQRHYFEFGDRVLEKGDNYVLDWDYDSENIFVWDGVGLVYFSDK